LSCVRRKTFTKVNLGGKPTELRFSLFFFFFAVKLSHFIVN
jgi:hypothetical protein